MKDRNIEGREMKQKNQDRKMYDKNIEGKEMMASEY
jgi:hypothetical protein